MPSKNPNDKILVNRSGVSYQAPIDMEALVESDLILVNRSGQSYKLTAGQWKELYGGISPGGGQFDAPTPVLSAEFPNVNQPMKLTIDLDAISNDAKDPVYVLATFLSTDGVVVAQTSIVANETFITIPPAAKNKTIYASVLYIDSTTPAPQQALRDSNQIGPIGDYLSFNIDIDVSPSGTYNGNKQVVATQLAVPALNDDMFWIGTGWCKPGPGRSGADPQNTGADGQGGSGIWFIKNQPLKLLVTEVNLEGGLVNFDIVRNGTGYPYDDTPYDQAPVTAITGSGADAKIAIQRVEDGEPGEYTANGVTAFGKNYEVGDEVCFTRPSENLSGGNNRTGPENLFDEEVDILVWGAGGAGGRNGNLNGPQNCNNCSSSASGGKGAVVMRDGSNGGSACGAGGGAGGKIANRTKVAWVNGGGGGSRAGGGGGGFPGGGGGGGERGCQVGGAGGGGAGYINPGFNVITETGSQLSRIKLGFSADDDYFFDESGNIGSPYLKRLIIGQDIQLPS